MTVCILIAVIELTSFFRCGTSVKVDVVLGKGPTWILIEHQFIVADDGHSFIGIEFSTTEALIVVVAGWLNSALLISKRMKLGSALLSFALEYMQYSEVWPCIGYGQLCALEGSSCVMVLVVSSN